MNFWFERRVSLARMLLYGIIMYFIGATTGLAALIILLLGWLMLGSVVVYFEEEEISKEEYEKETQNA